MTSNAIKLGKMPTLKWLKIDQIKVPEFRLHSRFENNADFEESIKTEGVIQPIYVFEDENGNCWLADGQNRLETLSKHKPIIPAYVLHGNKRDAILYSAKLNVLRGKVNVGELAEFVYNLYQEGMKIEEIADALRFSKGYVSQLVIIAENPQILENLKKGLISKEEAYKSAKSLLSKQESQETRQSETPSTFAPLTDEDSGVTTSLKQAIEEGKRFKPLGPDDLKPEREESKKTEFMTCDYCGKILSRLDVKWIKVHSDEYDKVLLAIHELAERETQKESSQP